MDSILQEKLEKIMTDTFDEIIASKFSAYVVEACESFDRQSVEDSNQ